MRLVTRADFDGLCCAALLKEIGLIDEFKFVNPKDAQDGLVEVDRNDILANIPYVEGAGMWFDHHASESERLKRERVSFKGLKGAVRAAPSAARVVWDYYGGEDKFPARFQEMMRAVDKVDSADLTEEEIKNPQGWILLGLLMDPRTGLGRHEGFRLGNWELLKELVEHIRAKNIDRILALEDIQERVAFYRNQTAEFEAMLREHARLEGNVIVVDLRRAEAMPAGNRFLVYALFPEGNISIQLMWDHNRNNVVFTVGHSVVNRTCQANVGKTLLDHGGGGHKRVGTCQVYAPMAEQTLAELVREFREEC